jgi:hypothetical protein
MTILGHLDLVRLFFRRFSERIASAKEGLASMLE